MLLKLCDFSNMAKTIRISLSIVLVLFLVENISCAKNNLIFSTKECYLTEPIYGHKFDFSSLHSELAHVVKSNKNDTFEFNLCGNLSRTCDGQNNVAACLKLNGKDHILGRQHELHYQHGKMYFEFSNGSTCPTGSGEYKLNVVVGCDYTIDKEQSSVTGYDDDDCSFYIIFETPFACLPEPETTKNNDCSAKDPKTGHLYDLLSLSDVNYRVSDRNGSEFIINICKPVLYGENAMCPAGSAICYKHSRDGNMNFENYGWASSKLVIENDQLLLKHSSPIKCNDKTNFTSIVKFYCDVNAKNPHPEYVGSRNCIYEFSFATPLACNDMPVCSVTTYNHEILDMSPLKDKPFTLNVDNKTYKIAVCSAAGSPCLEKDGACSEEGSQATSLGEMNSNLRFNQSGSAYLLYENGAPCQPTKVTDASSGLVAKTFWTTRIEFVCATNITKNNNNNTSASVSAPGVALGPKIIENSNCQLLVQYLTPLACQKQITCKAKVYVDYSEDGSGIETVDLTPLVSTTDNYEAKIDLISSSSQKVDKSTKFFLNVCRPLVPKYGLGCPGGSAACMAKQGPYTPEEEQSLGYPEAGLVAINRTNVQLRYFNGDVCQADKSTKMSTRIDFNCDVRAGRGVPVLREISDCHYDFSWATNVICPMHTCAFDEKTCEVKNSETNESFNLKNLPGTKNGLLSLEEFKFSPCQAHHKAVSDYSQGLVTFFFTAEANCHKVGGISYKTTLICSNETNSTPLVSSGCSFHDTHNTPEICKFLGINLPATPPGTNGPEVTPSPARPEHSIAHHPAEHTAGIGTILAAILSLTFFMACAGLFAFSPERRESVKRFFGGTASRVRYSRVRSNEEASLLLETNEAFTDSDDDMLL